MRRERGGVRDGYMGCGEVRRVGTRVGGDGGVGGV